MLDTILNLLGINLDTFNISDDVVFALCGIILLFCLGYVFNFFQCLLERVTARKGR